MMMDAKIRTKWVAALRSGDYKQGKSALRTVQDEFCCLGVLCDIVDPDGWERGTDVDSDVWRYNAGTLPTGIADTDTGYVPDSLAKRIGFTNGWAGTVTQGELAAKNDSGMSFAEIADFIEKNF